MIFWFFERLVYVLHVCTDNRVLYSSYQIYNSDVCLDKLGQIYTLEIVCKIKQDINLDNIKRKRKLTCTLSLDGEIDIYLDYCTLAKSNSVLS